MGFIYRKGQTQDFEVSAVTLCQISIYLSITDSTAGHVKEGRPVVRRDLGVIDVKSVKPWFSEPPACHHILPAPAGAESYCVIVVRAGVLLLADVIFLAVITPAAVFRAAAIVRAPSVLLPP